VDAGHWYKSKSILISLNKIERISYEESTVLVNLTVNDLQRTVEKHLAEADADHHAAAIFHD
jgi:hypothetical protein